MRVTMEQWVVVVMYSRNVFEAEKAAGFSWLSAAHVLWKPKCIDD
jgi:hypothetical protein